MVESRASSNVMPFNICEKLDVKPEDSFIQIIWLDKKRVKVTRELNNFLIRLSSNPKVHQTIDIVVVDIPNTYGIIFV